MSRSASVLMTHQPSGQRVLLGPGDFIGRSEMAALCLDDPRISEAHAMISLRDGALKLIALRGRFRHKGKVLSEVELVAGLEVELAGHVTLRCEHVEMPESMLGLLIGEELEVMLTTTLTLYTEDFPTLRRGYDPMGAAVFWSTGSQWRASLGSAPPIPLTLGDRLELDGTTIEVIAIELERAARAHTRKTIRSPWTFTCHEAHVDIAPEGQSLIRITGIPGKILLHLLRRGGSASCTQIIGDVWPEDASEPQALRRRFDAGLKRLRDHIACLLPQGEHLVALDGTGVIALTLAAQDRVESAHG